MKKILAPAIILAVFPFITHAQVGSFQQMFGNTIVFIDTVLIPFLFGIAFLFFVVNVIRYFVAGASNPTSQESAKSLATYGMAAFVFLIIFWGIVTMLVSSLGLGGCTPVMFDYYYDPITGPVSGGASPSPCVGTGGTTPPAQTFPEDFDAGYQLPGQYQERDI